MVGRVLTLDKTQLEDLIKFHNIEFQVLKGYYFDKGFNTKTRDSIQKICNNRLEMKAAKNPLELVYKLIISSGYGSKKYNESCRNRNKKLK